MGLITKITRDSDQLGRAYVEGIFREFERVFAGYM